MLRYRAVALSLATSLSLIACNDGGSGEGSLDDASPGGTQRGGLLIYNDFSTETREGPIPDATTSAPAPSLEFERDLEKSLIVGDSVYVSPESDDYTDPTVITGYYGSIVPMDGMERDVTHVYHGEGHSFHFDIVLPRNFDKSIPYLLSVAYEIDNRYTTDVSTLVMEAVDPGTSDLTITLEWEADVVFSHATS